MRLTDEELVYRVTLAELCQDKGLTVATLDAAALDARYEISNRDIDPETIAEIREKVRGHATEEAASIDGWQQVKLALAKVPAGTEVDVSGTVKVWL